MVTSVPDSFAEEKTIEESQIFQTFSKINKDMQAQDRKEMEIKLNTAYFVAKKELPFSKFEGLLQKKVELALTLRMQMIKVEHDSCRFCLHALKKILSNS